MKKRFTKTVGLILLALITLPVFGQENGNKFNLRLGIGYSILGTGDILTLNYENELNYSLNQYFTTSFSLNLGKSNQDIYKATSFIQSNLNIFISPFKNNKRNDFRIGTGLTYYKVSDAYRESSHYENGKFVRNNYELNNRISFGYNIIIEDSYFITKNLSIGLKLFTQPYFNGDINTGILIKAGVRL